MADNWHAPMHASQCTQSSFLSFLNVALPSAPNSNRELGQVPTHDAQPTQTSAFTLGTGMKASEKFLPGKKIKTHICQP